MILHYRFCNRRIFRGVDLPHCWKQNFLPNSVTSSPPSLTFFALLQAHWSSLCNSLYKTQSCLRVFLPFVFLKRLFALIFHVVALYHHSGLSSNVTASDSSLISFSYFLSLYTENFPEFKISLLIDWFVFYSLEYKLLKGREAGSGKIETHGHAKNKYLLMGLVISLFFIFCWDIPPQSFRLETRAILRVKIACLL